MTKAEERKKHRMVLWGWWALCALVGGRLRWAEERLMMLMLAGRRKKASHVLLQSCAPLRLSHVYCVE